MLPRDLKPANLLLTAEDHLKVPRRPPRHLRTSCQPSNQDERRANTPPPCHHPSLRSQPLSKRMPHHPAILARALPAAAAGGGGYTRSCARPRTT
jgi:hypothetical protein